MKTIVSLDEIILKTIKELSEVEGNSEEYKKVYSKLSKVIPPISKEKHNIWAGIYPSNKVFLDVITNGKELEKIVYFVDNKNKYEIVFNKKGEVKSKDKSSMGNYPRYYNKVKDTWIENFREINKEDKYILHNNKLIKPIQHEDEFILSNRSLDRAVMIHPETILQNDYNSIESSYRQLFGLDITKYIIQQAGDSNLYTKEGAEWVKIYALK